jgi:hypothetical protein
VKSRALKFAPSLLLLIVPLLLALVSQSGRIQPASAQTGGGTALPTVVATATPGTGGTVAICGPVTAFTAATATTAGTITFSTTNVVATYPILAGVTLVGQNAVAAGANVCLSGVLDANGNIANGVVTVNSPTTIVVCGPVTAYTAATASALGSVTIAGIVFPTALGSTFNGTALAAGTNVCLTAQLSALGNLVSGSAVVNTAGTLSLTGPFTSFIPPTAATNGFVTFGTVTFVIPAGSTITVGGGVPLAATVAGGGRSPGMRPL